MYEIWGKIGSYVKNFSAWRTFRTISHAPTTSTYLQNKNSFQQEECVPGAIVKVNSLPKWWFFLLLLFFSFIFFIVSRLYWVVLKIKKSESTPAYFFLLGTLMKVRNENSIFMRLMLSISAKKSEIRNFLQS